MLRLSMLYDILEKAKLQEKKDSINGCLEWKLTLREHAKT